MLIFVIQRAEAVFCEPAQALFSFESETLLPIWSAAIFLTSALPRTKEQGSVKYLRAALNPFWNKVDIKN